MRNDETNYDRRLLTEEDIREMVLRLAHEIRNPLATIKSGVQLIERLTSPVGEIAEHFAGVLAQVGRIDQTVHDMQRFVRLAAEEPTGLRAADVAEAAAADVRDDAEGRSVRVLLAGDRGTRVLAGAAQIREALVELVSNAVTFSPPGSTVIVSWTALESGEVAFHVDDEGAGVRPEHADRILRPFFSTSTQGTGLGLNIAEKICRLAGGRLEWRNLAGRGCRFTLALRGV